MKVGTSSTCSMLCGKGQMCPDSSLKLNFHFATLVQINIVYTEDIGFELPGHNGSTQEDQQGDLWMDAKRVR